MMATTYVPIQSVTLGSSASEITFTSIPQTYTDLMIRISSRSTYASTLGNIDLTSILVGLNGAPVSPSNTNLYGNGSTVASTRSTDGWMDIWAANPGSNNTANTFSSAEFYLPNYTGTANKCASSFAVMENNTATTGPFIAINALLDTRTVAITQIKLASGAGSFASGSSFHLYGIKNS